LKTFNFRTFIATAALTVFAIVGTSELTNAQGHGNGKKNDQKREQKMEKERARIEQERIRAEQQQQAEWSRQDSNSGNDRSRGMGYYRGNANANTNRNGRYRVNRNGSFYNTDNRGADLLRKAVNEGYRQGFQAGRNDRNSDTRRRSTTWSNSTVYQTGTYGYQNYVDRGQYQYYFRQGFQRGYQDGSNTQYRDDYNGRYQFGTNNGGSLSILDTILNQVLNIQSY